MKRTIRVLVEGVVQGVGYRAFVEDEALARGIAGWVRNRRSGQVEAVFSAESDVVAAMIEACRRGPRQARVERVDVTEMPAEEGLAGFRILPTH